MREITREEIKPFDESHIIGRDAPRHVRNEKNRGTAVLFSSRRGAEDAEFFKCPFTAKCRFPDGRKVKSLRFKW